MEITNNTLQTINAGNNVLFTDTPVPGSCSIIHRDGSGLVTLRGMRGQSRARFRVFFGANIAIPSGTSVTSAIENVLSISINGEPIETTNMISTSSTAGAFHNVSTSIFIEVPCCCCTTISVENSGTSAVSVTNANLIVERVA